MNRVSTHQCPGCDSMFSLTAWREEDGPCHDERYWCLDIDCQKEHGCGCVGPGSSKGRTSVFEAESAGSTPAPGSRQSGSGSGKPPLKTAVDLAEAEPCPIKDCGEAVASYMCETHWKKVSRRLKTMIAKNPEKWLPKAIRLVERGR